MKKWIMGLAVASLAVGGLSGPVWAFDLGDLDPTNWMDECKIGKFFNAVDDGTFNTSGFIGWGSDVIGGDCDTSDLDMIEFNLDEVNPRWSSGATATNGKLTVDIRRRYGFDTNANWSYVEVFTPWGKNWRWRKTSTGEYYKARYAVTSNNVNGLLQLSVIGSAIPNTKSQTPASYTTPKAYAPSGYTQLAETRFGGATQTPYFVTVPNVGKVWHVAKVVKAKSLMKNSAGKSKLVEFAAGKVWAKSVPAYGKRYQHIVYRP